MELTKNKVIVALSAIIIVLACFLSYANNLAVKNKKKAETLENTISDMNQEMKVSKIALNDSIALQKAEVKDLQVTNKNLEAKFGDLLNSSGIKTKYVDRIVTVTSETSGRDTVICQVDSFGGLEAHVSDGFALIDVNVSKERRAIVDYTIKDSLMVINYQKKHSILFGLIKWNEYLKTDVINYNPKASFKTLNSYKTIE